MCVWFDANQDPLLQMHTYCVQLCMNINVCDYIQCTECARWPPKWVDHVFLHSTLTSIVLACVCMCAAADAVASSTLDVVVVVVVVRCVRHRRFGISG